MIEDIEAVQTLKNLRSPSPVKGKNSYLDTENSEDDDQNRAGCIKFKPSNNQSITLDIRPKEPRKDFVFRSIFRPESSQIEVFEKTALPLVMHVLNGYNGTFFVYG